MKNYKELIYQSYLQTCYKDLKSLLRFRLNPREAYLTNIVKRFFPKDRNSKILDLGCGNGALLYFAKKNGYQNIKGLDVSAMQVEEAGAIGLSEAEVECLDFVGHLENLPAESYDFIISFDVLEHLSKQEIFNFGANVFRLLKKDGTWLIHAPNGESLFGNRVLFGDFTHEISFTCSSLEQIKNALGFSKAFFFEDEPAVHGIKSLIRYLLWKLIRLMPALWLAIETGSPGKIHSQNLIALLKKQGQTKT
ncbi:MAG: class I SAM-dependent methyltransferase [Candidatus Riflebacteria bacterium]|nr:class I SAM-dependent methyltransferase [Candidatus Riflebacteria bacterium]